MVRAGLVHGLGTVLFGICWLTAWVLFILGAAFSFEGEVKTTRTLWIITFSILIAVSILQILIEFFSMRRGPGQAARTSSIWIPILFLVANILLLVGTCLLGPSDSDLRTIGILWVISGIPVVAAGMYGVIWNSVSICDF
jgi:hypothetical protein